MYLINRGSHFDDRAADVLTLGEATPRLLAVAGLAC